MSLFVPKEWKDRLAEFAGRRKLTNVSTGEETTVDVSRAEGEVSQAGDAFSAANMNDLEQRIKDGFDKVDTNFIANIYVGDDGKLHKVQGGADSVLPFSNYEEGSGYLKYGSSTTITFKNKYTNIPLVAVSQVDSNGHSVAGTDGYRFYFSSVTKTSAKLEITSVLGAVGAYYRYIVISND